MASDRTSHAGGAVYRANGFSLVEVVSSLGIVSFGLIALLGLLPMGLQVSREARESTAEAQINQYLSNLARQTETSRLPEILDPRVFYFDRQGLPVAADATERFYRANLTQVRAPAAPESADLSYQSASLGTVQVSLRKCHGSEPASVKSVHRIVAVP